MAPLHRGVPHPEQLAAQLARLVTVALAGNGFYQRKLAGTRVDLSDPEVYLKHCPLTTKEELVTDQAEHPPYGTNLSHPLEHYTRCHQTSGTTGAPLRWLDTPASWDGMVADWRQVWDASGITSADRILFAFSFGPFIGFWLGFESAQQLGALCLSGGGMSSLKRLKLLSENACTVLCCTPTYGLHLADLAQKEGLNLSAIAPRMLLVAGEPGGSLPVTRQRLSDAWHGARVFDHHGMTEVGPVSFEHPEQPGSLVVMEDSFLAEILDPNDGTPVQPDASGLFTGELVLTTLKRTASPLLRFRTGDLVSACREQGRLLLKGGILGRVDDMCVVRGVNVYPSAIEEVVKRFPEIEEYRVTVDRRGSMTELQLEVEADDATVKKLSDKLHDALALRVMVRLVPPGSLPRFEMKAKRWQVLG